MDDFLFGGRGGGEEEEDDEEEAEEEEGNGLFEAVKRNAALSAVVGDWVSFFVVCLFVFVFVFIIVFVWFLYGWWLFGGREGGGGGGDFGFVRVLFYYRQQ